MEQNTTFRKATVIEWLKGSLEKIWDGVLNNIGAILIAFVLSGGYLAALSYIEKFQRLINSVPSQWFLTPLVLLLILVGVLTRTSYKQRRELADVRTQQPSKNEGSRLVTHLGVWWKIYPTSRYIEDFPYCPCCEPPAKLVQTEWFEDEVYKCPHKGTELKLYAGIPKKRQDVLRGLYSSYFRDRGSDFYEHFVNEFQRRKELSSHSDNGAILKEMLEVEPLCRIPTEERDNILAKHPEPMRFASFINRHYNKYAKYLESVDHDHNA